MMQLYLYTVVNNHPSVKKRYKYIVKAYNRRDAIDRMQWADGGLNDGDVIESCELIPSVEHNAWYLPDYTPEDII